MRSVKRCPNTLWHPVKPHGNYGNWQRVKFDGGFHKKFYEAIKPLLGKVITELWFLTKWKQTTLSLNGPTADVQAYSHHSADPSHRVAIVLLTHFYNQSIQSLYERLRDEAPEGYDVFVHINGKTDFNPASTKLPTASISISSDKSLMDLRYPTKCKGSGEKPWSIYGNNDLPLLHFWRNHRNYQFYWGIEYDVHYEGNWKRFFKYFSGSHADLLGADMHSAAETPSNRLDPCLCDPNGQEQDQSVIVRGFYPLFRLSQRAITAIDLTYQAGWCGHYETGMGHFCCKCRLQS